MERPPEDTATRGPPQFSWRAASLLALTAMGLMVFLAFRNAGLYPSVFADEYTYSLYSRLAPWAESTIPSYLYLALFKVTRQCGTAFLDCARALNVLFLLGAMPFIYSVCRSVASWRLALLVTFLAMIGPYNTYTAYFMPESMYFFGFWAVSWFVLRAAPAREWQLGATLGALLGLLTLVKMHGMFLFAGLGCFFAWSYLRKARPFSLGGAAQLAASALATFFVVRMALGYLLAGPSGLHLLGKAYGGVASTAKPGTIEVLRQVGEVALGHGMGMLLLFAVPLGLALTPGAKQEASSPLRNTERYLLAMLLPLLTIVVFFTVSISGAGPYETATRLHMRYYNFIFPLFSIVLAGHFSAWHAEPLRKARHERWIFAALAVPTSWAVFTHLAPFTPFLADCPELRGLTLNPSSLLFMGGLGVLSLVVGAFRPRWGVGLFLLVFTPLAVGVSTYWANFELRDRHAGDPYDRGGEFARKLLGAQTRHLLVAGPDAAGLFRARFAIDDPGTQAAAYTPGQALAAGLVPPETNWILYIGAPPPDETPVAPTAPLGFSLVQVKH